MGGTSRQLDHTEEALQETIARHEAVLASTLDPIVTIDADGTILSASNSVERVFGYEPDELIGRNVNVLMPEPHHSQHDQYLANYRRTGKTNILGRAREFEAVRKNGSWFPVEISVARVDVPGKQMPLFTGILRDISERRQTEQAMRLLQRLALGLGGGEDLDRALTFALKEVCHVTGWDYGEAWLPDSNRDTMRLGPQWCGEDADLKQFARLSAKRTFRAGEGLIGAVLATRQPKWLESIAEAESPRFVRRQEAIDAGLVTCFGIPVVLGDDVPAVLAFYSRTHHPMNEWLLELVLAATAQLGPIIQRRRAEDALLESERRLREMLNRVEMPAVMVNRDERVTFANDALLQLTGRTSEETIGSNWFDTFIPESDRSRLRELLGNAVTRDEIPERVESGLLTRDRGPRQILWGASVLHDASGRPVGATGLGMDVTEQRRVAAELDAHRRHLEDLVRQRTEELESTHEQLRVADRLASIGTLAAGLGHDMNNVLLPVRCRLDAMEEHDLPDSLREHLQAVRRSVDYLQQLTDGLHLFALDPEDTEASSVTTEVAEWWSRVAPLLGRAAPDHIDLIVHFEDALPPIAVAPHRLTQAVLNLIVNAGEAVEEQAPEQGLIRLDAAAVDDQRFVQLTVTDNGIGMDEETKRYALDPFFTTKRRRMGTGLGLSLVHGVVKGAGGSIHIESAPGRGTSITLTLPAIAAAPSEEESVDEAAGVAVVAVNDPRVATMIEAMLAGSGFTVHHADGELPARCALRVVDRDHRPGLTEPGDGKPDGVRDRPLTVVLGKSEPVPDHEHVLSVEDPGDIDAIRRGLGEAMARLQEQIAGLPSSRAAAESEEPGKDS